MVVIGVLVSVLVSALAITDVGTAASAGPPPAVRGERAAEAALSRELARDPVGRVDDNRIYRPDGTVFVALDAGVSSLGQCESGWFCLWSQTSYQGSFYYRSVVGVYDLSGTIRSVWNNRTAAARLYSNTGASSTCYVAGQRSASLSASYTTPQKVALLSGGC